MLAALKKHPVISAFGIGILTLVFEWIAVYAFCVAITSSAKCPEYPGDPCDAAPMLVMSIFIVSLPVTILVAVFVLVIALVALPREEM